jgi:uncharacterized protein YoxC
MDILALLRTIQEEWALLVFFFTLGGVWWQGRAWFDRVNNTLTSVGQQHAEQNRLLENIHDKTERLTEHVAAMDEKLQEVHDKVHDQEIKLAVLESKSSRGVRAAKA